MLGSIFVTLAPNARGERDLLLGSCSSLAAVNIPVGSSLNPTQCCLVLAGFWVAGGLSDALVRLSLAKFERHVFKSLLSYSGMYYK